MDARFYTFDWNNPTDVNVFCFKLHKFVRHMVHLLIPLFFLFFVVSVPRCWSSGRCLNAKRSEDAGNQTFGNVEANAWVYGLGTLHSISAFTQNWLIHPWGIYYYCENLFWTSIFLYLCKVFCLVWTGRFHVYVCNPCSAPSNGSIQKI